MALGGGPRRTTWRRGAEKPPCGEARRAIGNSVGTRSTGTSRATGVPWFVTVKDSPAATARSTSLLRLRISRWLIDSTRGA